MRQPRTWSYRITDTRIEIASSTGTARSSVALCLAALRNVGSSIALR